MKYLWPLAVLFLSNFLTAQESENPLFSSFEEYKKAKSVTKKRLYLEAMEDILPGIEKFIVPDGEGGNLLNLLNLTGNKKGDK